MQNWSIHSRIIHPCLLTIFPVCIIHPLVTMLATSKMNQSLASLEGNLAVQVVRLTRPCNMKSGALLCCMSWPTYPKWSRTCSKCSIHYFSTSHKFVSNSASSHCYREFNEQFWHESREPTLEEASALVRDGVGNDMPDFISWFKQKVLSNLAITPTWFHF